jgi:hypothetical protein
MKEREDDSDSEDELAGRARKDTTESEEDEQPSDEQTPSPQALHHAEHRQQPLSPVVIQQQS